VSVTSYEQQKVVRKSLWTPATKSRHNRHIKIHIPFPLEKPGEESALKKVGNINSLVEPLLDLLYKQQLQERKTSTMKVKYHE
jgi:hypothetical protein